MVSPELEILYRDFRLMGFMSRANQGDIFAVTLAIELVERVPTREIFDDNLRPNEFLLIENREHGRRAIVICDGPSW